jgi:hypothetical protein
MRNLVQFGAFLALACTAWSQAEVHVDDDPAPSDSEQKIILARVTENALKYSKDLPDFVCNKLTRHSADITGRGQQWRLLDSSDEELSYVGQKENYQIVAVNGKRGSGSGQPRSTAYEFGTWQSWVFAPAAHAELRWSSWTTINKRRAYAFAIGVTQPNSQFFVGTGKNRMAVGFLGVFYADAETGKIIRVLLIGQSPATSPVKNITYDLSYDFVKIGDQQFVVPVKSDFRVSEGKSLVWTEVEFRRYRKPGVDPADKFETR